MSVAGTRMRKFAYEFEAQVVVHDFGRMAYTVVNVPRKLTRKLPLAKHPRLRIDGIVAGHPFHGALQPAGQGKYYLILSKKFCKAADLNVGEMAVVCFDIADQEAVDVPRELLLALNANDGAMNTWQSLSAGKKRGFAYRVASAKRVATRELRVEEVLESLLQVEDDVTQS